MESQRTTHLLLAIIIAGIVVIIVLVARQTTWERSWFLQIIEDNAMQNLPSEQTMVPMPPEVVILPTPTPEPEPPTVIENINLITGQLYNTAFYADATPNPKMKYCGERTHTLPGESTRNYMFFVPAGAACLTGTSVPNGEGFSLTQFMVSPKAGLGASVVNNLNQKYGATTETVGEDTYVINVGTSGVSSYTLASLYFQTGLFTWAQPVSGFSIMMNN